MKNIARLLRYVRQDKGSLVLYFVCSLLSTVFALFSFSMIAPVLQAIFTGVQTLPNASTGGFNLITSVTRFFNEVIAQQGRMAALSYATVLVVLATILKNIFLYLSQRILNPLKNKVLRRLREDMFNKSLSLPIGYFTEEKKGDLISKMTNDVSEVEHSIISVVETVLREPITIIGVLALMFSMSLHLTLFMLLFLPLSGLIIGRVSKSLKKPSNKAQEQLGEMLGTIDETLVGMRVVKAFNAETQQRAKFSLLNNDLFRIKNKIAARRDAGSPMSETLGVLVVCIILWFGGKLIFEGQTTLTGPFFIVYIALFYQIINPLKNLSNMFYNMQKGTAALNRMEAFLAVENNIKEKPDATSLPDFSDAIVLRDVGFKYGDKTVLSDINLTIKKGQTVALVGASGAGKSTLVDLIPRFHDVSSGSISIDGKELRDLRIFDLRKLIGVVSQEPILFNDTIYNNITLGTAGAGKAAVEAAARIANAHHFIEQKQAGYDTIVGERGSKLSGGERQRITIARAVLKNPPILILDEATSSLDTASEKIVQDALNELMKNRTSIVIAHRLSTIYHADLIVVMAQGKIVERGTHQSLMDLNGTYKNLVSMQQFK